MPEYARMVAIDYRGTAHVLGRTSEGYAIWLADAGGEPLFDFPLTPEGWSLAWGRFQGLEGGGPVRRVEGPAGTIPPLDLAGVLGGTFQTLGRNFWVLFLTVAAIQVPFVILQLVVLQAVLPVELELLFSGAVPANELGAYREIIQEHLGGFIAAAVGLGVVSIFVTGFLNAALIRGGLQGFLGSRVRMGDLLSASVGRTLSMAWVLFLVGLILVAVILPLFLLWFVLLEATDIELVHVVMGIGIALLALLVYARYLVAPVALIAEGQRGTAAVRRASGLSRGRIWPILGTFVLVILIGGLASFLVSLPFGTMAQAQTSLRAFWIFSSIGGLLTNCLLLPFSTLAVVHLYVDARARKEALQPSDLLPPDAREPA